MIAVVVAFPSHHSFIDQLKNQYETNVFGVYATIKAFLPYLRRNKAGTIINLSSSSAQFNFPFISGYGSTKWAVRGITESLGIELAPFHIHVKAIYPGLHATDIFTKLDHGGDPEHPSYQAHKPFFRNFMSAQTIYDKGTVPDRAAREIWRAVDNRAKGKLHFITDGDAKFLAFTRKILSERRFQNMQIGTIQKPAQQNQKGFITWLFGKHVKEVKTDIPGALIR